MAAGTDIEQNFELAMKEYFYTENQVNMKTLLFVLQLTILTCFTSCRSQNEKPKEEWIEKPMEEWPIIVLTNEISFTDTTYSDLANSFLIDTGYDTIGVSTKHLFMVFQYYSGLNSIELGEEFSYWNFYPKNHPGQIIPTKNLINRNTNEPIGEFRTIKDRDWIIFEIDKWEVNVYPLKIRFTPIRKDEIVYTIGYGIRHENNNNPAMTKLKCYQSSGTYYYMQNLSKDSKPEGTSGSPVIDSNGYLVGIVSGAEGNLGVIGGTTYLKRVLDQHKIPYKE